MPVFPWPTRPVVRLPRGWKEVGATLGVAFVLVAAVVFAFGWITSSSSLRPVDETATATVRVEIDPGQGEADSPAAVLGQPVWPWIDEVCRQAKAQTALESAKDVASEMPVAGSDATQSLASADVDGSPFEVELKAGSGPGKTVLRLTCRQGAPEAAAAQVNRLAEDVGTLLRADWRSRSEQACTKAEAELEQARETRRQAEAALQAFRREMAERVAASQKVTPPATEPPLVAPAPAEPTVVENPDWAVVFQEIEQLNLHRAELLVSRTPVHPSVVDVDERIGSLRRQLAAIPRSIAVEPPEEPGLSLELSEPVAEREPPAVATAEPELPAAHASSDSAAAAELARLEAAAADATERCRQVEAVELAVRTRCGAGPRIQWTAATVPAPTADGGVRFDWLLASLAAGLAAAVGVGLISGGLAMERPLDSIERIEALCSAPVLAEIPSAEGDVVSESCLRAQHRPALRALLMVGGALILVAVVGLVVGG